MKNNLVLRVHTITTQKKLNLELKIAFFLILSTPEGI
jgi:hypothetical protein